MTRRRGSLLWLGLIIALGIGLGVLTLAPLRRSDGSQPIASLVGQSAPALAADDLDGRAWSVDNAEGRLVWINFLATWCPPCRTEMPAMQALAESHPDELLILGVDWGEERTAVDSFVARYGIEYPILLDPTLDNYYRWAQASGLPRHSFVRDGVIVREVIGPLDPADMVTILAKLLAS